MFNLNFTEEQLKACQYALNNHMDFVMSVPHLLRQDLQYSILEHLKENAIGDSQNEMEKKADEFIVNRMDLYNKHIGKLMKSCFDNDIERANRFIEKLAYAKKTTDIINLVNDLRIKKNKHKSKDYFENVSDFTRTIQFFINRNKINYKEDTLRKELSKILDINHNDTVYE